MHLQHSYAIAALVIGLLTQLAGAAAPPRTKPPVCDALEGEWVLTRVEGAEQEGVKDGPPLSQISMRSISA